MTILSTIRADIRVRLIETSAEYYTDAELLTYINYACREFARKTEWVERVKAYPLVANQFDYSLPSDVLKVSGLWWQDQYKIEQDDLEEFYYRVGAGFPASGVPPKAYRLFPHGLSFRLHPRPATASAASTLTGTHNTSVTTLNVTDTTSFPSSGYAIINGSEQVKYYAKTATTLLQVIRGDGGTTAASYIANDPISAAPLLVYHTYLPADLSADGDSLANPRQYDSAIAEYALGLALQKSGKDASKYHLSRAEASFKEALGEREKMQRDKLFAFKDPYFDGI